jgi:hypothetical protein
MTAGTLSAPNASWPPVVHPFLERRAVDELADDVAPVAFRRRLDNAGRDERLDLVNGVELAGQPLQYVGVDGRPQHLDRHPLFARVRASAQVDDALPALAEPSEQLETAQAHGIAGLQRSGRHRLSPGWLGGYDNAAVIRVAPQCGRRIRDQRC